MPLMHIGDCANCEKPVYVGGTLRGWDDFMEFDDTGRPASYEVWHRSCTPLRDLVSRIVRACGRRNHADEDGGS